MKFVILTLCVMNCIVSEFTMMQQDSWTNGGDFGADMSGEEVDTMSYSSQSGGDNFQDYEADMQEASASGDDFAMENATSYGMSQSMQQSQDSQILTATQFSKPVVTERRMSRPYVVQKIIQRPVIKRKIV